MDGQVGVLEIAEPVGHAEVEQVEDRRDAELAHPFHGAVAAGPVVDPVADVRVVPRQAVAQQAEAQILDEMQVLLPACVVPALDEHVAAQTASAPIVDRRVGALDPGREAEIALVFRQAAPVRADGPGRWRREVEVVAERSAERLEETLARHREPSLPPRADAGPNLAARCSRTPVQRSSG